MQQHTGQHVLSAAFDQLFGVRTVSFHLGAEVSTIDLAREMSPAEIAAAEAEANRIVWEDRPVAIRFADAEEAARLPLRKEPARGGMLRLIDVEEFDLSACGGTHVARTGGIGVIAVAVVGAVQGRPAARVSSAAAARSAATERCAMRCRERPAAVGAAGRAAGAIERLQAEAKEQKRSMTALQNELARFRADELAAQAADLEPKTDGIAAASGGARRRRRRERAEDRSRPPSSRSPGFSSLWCPARPRARRDRTFG